MVSKFNTGSQSPSKHSRGGLGVRTHGGSLALAGLTLWLGACGIVTIKSAGAGDEAAWSQERPARYDGDECYQVLYTLEESRNQSPIPEQDDTPEKQVLLATCARHENGPQTLRNTQDAKIKGWEFRDVYPTYDDRKPDLVRLAVMASNERFSEQRAMRQEMRGRGFDKEPYDMARDALLSVILKPISESELTQALAAVQVPEDAKQALIENFREARSFFTHESNQLEGPLKELLVDTPQRVLERRRSQFEVQAANWSTFDGFAERIKSAPSKSGGDPELRSDLEALRPKVVATAKGDYVEDPLFARLTREIALQAALMQDAATLAAERMVYRRGRSADPFPETFAQEVQYAQLGLVSEFEQARREFRKAKDAGLDDAAAKARAGGDYADWNPSKLVSVDPGIPDYEKLLEKTGTALPFLEVVETIKPEGDEVVVSFKKTPVETFEYYGCYKTNRIERISSDGRIEYEEHCNTRPKTVMHENVKPLKFPADEGKQLKRGAKIRGVSVGSEGRVVWLIVKDEIVSERGYPVPFRPANPKAKD